MNTVCDVCRLLDGDYSVKLCDFCRRCEAWICKACQRNPARRIKAAFMQQMYERKVSFF